MRLNYLRKTLKTAVFVASVLLLGAGMLSAQQVINLTAGPATATMSDGRAVPMWGYSCGTAATGSTATCAALNPAATSPAIWSPVVITVPTGQGLTINLTNNLSFTPTGSTTANTVPTSITIVGEVGGGLGGTPTTTTSPAHGQTSVTWSTVTSSTFTPPPQQARVQSFGTEVAAGATTALTWPAASLLPGTYLIESGTHPSIQGPMGLYGILVVTTVPTSTAAGTAYPAVGTTPAVAYNAEIPLAFSEIDPVQNNAVNTAVNTAGFSETKVWSGQPGGCGNPTSPVGVVNTCYPPAVNYTPLYYMINGVPFNKTNSTASLFPTLPATGLAAGGSVLVRMVNAGLRMHVPSIVGSQTSYQGIATAVPPVATGFSLIAEDGNVLPGVPRVQSEVFMAAGKTYDVMINVPAAGGTALPVYDRELSLSGNAVGRDAGMLAYIGVNGATLPAAGAIAPAVARPDTYNSLVPCAATPCPAFAVSDPGKGLIANDTNVYGVQLLTAPTAGTVTLNANGTFSYVPSSAGSAATPDSFTYCANGSVTAGVCSSGITATVSLGAAAIEAASGITTNPITYTAKVAGYLNIKTPGVLSVDNDAAGYPLKVAVSTITPSAGLTVNMDQNGGFTATLSPANTAAAVATFTYQAQNSQGTLSAAATVTINFPAPSNLAVTLLDGQSKVALSGSPQDYRWIIEEDRSFYVDPNCTTNPPPAGCPTSASGIVPTFGVNFHTSDMPYVAQGCTGPLSCESGQTLLGVAAACDQGDGVCRTTASQKTAVLPGQVTLDPTKRYYISVLPGDAANPFTNGNTTASCSAGSAGSSSCGHTMGGAPIPAACKPVPPATTCTGTFAPVNVLVQPSPLPPSKLSVFVFEDDFPLNGEHDAGGGVDALSPQEPGLGGFQIHLWDAMGGAGDFTGQMSYDMFNQPLTNSLDGTIDPATGFNACPISKAAAASGSGGAAVSGITGMIVTCPNYESDGKTLSPLGGQALVSNVMPMRLAVIATPGADRIARGEEWLQTNTLDGQKGHDAFLRIGEPSYFQEFGPASYHVSIGFANPKIISGRLPGVCSGTDVNVTPGTGTPLNCNNTVTGSVTTERMSRTPDERLYSSGSHDSFYWTQCYVSLGDPDGEDFAFTRCDATGHFSFSGIPSGDWRITVFDQWNDMLVDGLSTPVRVGSTTSVCPGTGSTATNCNMGEIAMNQWQSNIYTRTFVDDNKDGLSQSTEAGIPLVNTAIRYRDGSLANNLVTDFTGTANFNETFPLFNWYVVETDTTRYKNTGTHVVYDAGGPADGTTACGQSGYPPCGTSTIGKFLANTAEQISLPASLRVAGSVYCAGADCSGKSIQSGPSTSDPPSACTTSTTGTVTCSTQLSTGRIDNPWTGATEGWQGFSGQNNFIEFGKEPYVPGENGGIKGHVIYASTRPFDDPQMLVQTQWEPLVPHVTINLYQEGLAADGVTPTLKLVDTTQTSSFDDFAQGFRADGVTPNMNCPGQGASTGVDADLFFFSLYDQPNYLDVYNAAHGGPAAVALPFNSQFKCYDGMHNWNQVQPAPYDGMYKFPSVTAVDANGKPSATNCTVCTANTLVPATDLYYGTPMLPTGKYVVEVVPPPGYELVKEEDKNILIGDNFIAPVTQQFGGLGNIFIMPDQASVASSYNANNAQNMTQSLGASPNNGIVPGFVPEPTWPCVGESRIVPDYISLFPQSKQVSPFAGASRHLCDRKEVTLSDQMGAIAKFFIYTSTHKASKFAGVITDDFTSEFDPFSPQFGEKFSPPDLPVAVKDWSGAEISRVYADHWGAYNGLTYSTWEVNPPNPTGYSPTMMVMCMNDPGTAANPDPLFNPAYSQFCYELPYMPGTTDYLDTPVVPTTAFAGAGYNNVDCDYPALTPSIGEVDGDGVGPWVAGPGHTLTIYTINGKNTPTGTIAGDQAVNNNAYSGPQATTAPYNQKTVTRHYGFGASRGTVTIGGRNVGVTSWSDTQITVTVPGNIPNCTIQQQAQYGGSTAQCGQLVITAANGQQSVDTVTVTVGGKAPTIVSSTAPLTQNGPGAIQQAIDNAKPGDLIIVPPGIYQEMILMWKPVRLQGVGAASSIINANTQPAGKLDPWRRQVNCLFGLSINGTPISGTNPYDSPSDTANNGAPYVCPAAMNFAVDRLPLESVVGWNASLNGNLAEMLQEPSLMGAYEGAGITVLAKGALFPPGSDPFQSNNATPGVFPTGTTLLTSANCGPNTSTSVNPFPSNFWCNPSSIDGLGVTDSSQGGGGIFVHAWGHNLQVANNRIYNNIGTLSGGLSVGQGEFPPQYLQGSATNAAPGSCQTSATPNAALPYCHNLNVNVHNNRISKNESIGDELFSATLAGAGGASFCTGSDYYQFNYNWLCGNMSTGDGGGFAHMGFSFNGDIEHNSILFNQSLNPTIPTNGGGIIIMGAPDTDPVCSLAPDQDCPPGTSDGTGPNLVINANLIQGNAAESGSGGGLRFQGVNGTEIASFPTTPAQWYSVNVTNNIIANNVAGWDGAGISLQDALAVNITNNTIVSNDTTASSGVLFNTLGAPLASATGPTCTANCGTASAPQPAGLVAIQNSAPLVVTMAASATPTAPIVCPTNHPNCTSISYPTLNNNIFWQNRYFHISVGALGAGTTNQQNVVTLVPTLNQTATGQCVAGATYWDIGVRGDTGPGNHSSTFTLAPNYSVLTNASEAGTGANNFPGTNPTVIAQYCNGSRIPPQLGSMGYQVPPGISDATVPNPIFNLTPAATVDEGNNWINMTWGPLSMVDPVTSTSTVNIVLGNYSPAAGSPVIDAIPTTVSHPSTDFFGNPRPDTGAPTRFDVGAVEVQRTGGGVSAPTLTAITPNSGPRGTVVSVTLTGTNLTGATWSAANTTNYPNITATGFTVVNSATITLNLNIGVTTTLGVKNFSVTTPGGTSNTVAFTVTVNPLAPTLTSIAPASGAHGAAVPVTFTGTNLTGATWSAANTTTYPNITVTGLTVVSATQVTATLHISNATTLGVKNFSLTTANGVSNTVAFTVTGGTIAFAGPTPALTTATANTTTKTGTITVSNTATGANAGPLTLTAAPTITRTAGAGTFSITGGTCTSGTVIAAGGNCTITVQYAPGTSTATATAHVTIADTGATTATQNSPNFNGN